MVKLSFCFFLLLNFFLEGASFVLMDAPHLARDQVFLLSTPRSGTNLTIGSLQIIAKIPCFFVYQENIEKSWQDENRLLIDLDFSKSPLLRTHSYATLQGISSTENRLIFLTRNPKELILRNLGEKLSEKKEEAQKLITKYLSYYLAMFRFFDHWELSHRLLVYYEELLLYPKQTLKRILEFLRENDKGLKNYMDHIETYQAKILDSYHHQHQSKSKGIDILYYSKRSSQKVLLELDAIIKAMDLELWHKYLHRFKTFEGLSLTLEGGSQ